jgi:tyrosine-specific transport protein
MMSKKFLATMFTLSGTIIGAGILGLPYVFAKSGFLTGLFWIVVLGAVMMFTNLALGEVTLRTRGVHQLAGYAEKYLGKWAKRIMFFAMLFGIYSALLAYLIGEGESLSRLLPGNINPLILGFAFWVVMTLLLHEGMKGLKKVETYGVIAIIGIVVGIFFWFLPRIAVPNLMASDLTNFALPVGVVMFALLGFTSIPELRREIRGEEKKLKLAIILGTLIPIILYILFSAVFVGVLGKGVSEVATLSFGPFITILGIFTMLTSYFVLAFSVKDLFKYDLKSSPMVSFVFSAIVPLLLYLLVSSFKMAGFAMILGIGGVISGGITGILIVLMNKKSKSSKKKPEFVVPMNWIIVALITIIFITGIFVEFFV